MLGVLLRAIYNHSIGIFLQLLLRSGSTQSISSGLPPRLPKRIYIGVSGLGSGYIVEWNN